MRLEIEKKFLIFEGGKNYSTPDLSGLFDSISVLRDIVLRTGTKIRQGYLPVEVGKEISHIVGFGNLFEPHEARLRNAGKRYFLTLKTDGDISRGESPDIEISRTIFELYWPYAKRRIEKVRLERPYFEHVAEIDVYADRDLIVAEVEVPNEEIAEKVIPLGKDVTNDRGYKNRALAKRDFHRKFILTGGPNSGKSSTIEYIARMQYPIIPEAARKIIDEQQENNGDIVPWERFLEFQLEVLYASLRAEQDLMEEGTVFLDRGISDAIVYCVNANIDPPLPLKDAVRNQEYKGIFVLDPLPRYQKDTARKEDSGEAARIHRNLLDLYNKLGYNPITVPSNFNLPLEESIRERAHLIISKSHCIN